MRKSTEGNFTITIDRNIDWVMRSKVEIATAKLQVCSLELDKVVEEVAKWLEREPRNAMLYNAKKKLEASVQGYEALQEDLECELSASEGSFGGDRLKAKLDEAEEAMANHELLMVIYTLNKA